jgi:hypothetical protein
LRDQNPEVMTLISVNQLWGMGVGWVDVHLLASALLSHCRIWTLDQRLGAAAQKLGVNYC